MTTQDYLKCRRYYENHTSEVKDILAEGTKNARIITSETLRNVKEAMKIDYFK